MELAAERDEARVEERSLADKRALITRALGADSPAGRLELLHEAHERDLNDPVAMSYYGMALAEVQHHYQQGIVFCEEAVRRLGPSPELLVNLAKAYIAAKNKREAVRTLRRAMARAGGADERAQVELASLGLRRRPVIPFLPRSFFLNRILGRLRHRLLDRKSPKDDGSKPIPAELGQLSGDLDEARRSLPPPAAKDDSR